MQRKSNGESVTDRGTLQVSYNGVISSNWQHETHG